MLDLDATDDDVDQPGQMNSVVIYSLVSVIGSKYYNKLNNYYCVSFGYSLAAIHNVSFFTAGDSSDGSTLFTVDTANGQVKTTSLLDTDTGVTEYELVVKASDGGTPALFVTASVTMTIDDINEYDPEFTESLQASITI